MGIKSAFSAVKAVFVRYSSFLGMLYLSTPENEASIKEAKSAVGGDEAVKKGFTGYKGDSPSAKARTILNEKGIMPVKLEDVHLTSVKLTEVDVQGTKEPYLSVGFTDDEGRYVVSLSVAHPAAQMLIRKLVNAKPKATSELNMYAQYVQNEKSGEYFAEHKVFLVQDGEQVKGIDPKTTFVPAVDAALKVLADAGIDDKKVIKARRDSVVLNFHVDLLKQIETKFKEATSDTASHEDDPLPEDFDPADVPF